MTSKVLDGNKPGWRRGGDFATGTADWWLGCIERNGSYPTSHGQWVDTDLLTKLPMVEPRVPELPDQLIDLGSVATAARALDIMHPALSPGSDRIENQRDYRTLRLGLKQNGIFVLSIETKVVVHAQHQKANLYPYQWLSQSKSIHWKPEASIYPATSPLAH
jgi:hypothetical protein